jgi:hypothetical protein
MFGTVSTEEVIRIKRSWKSKKVGEGPGEAGNEAYWKICKERSFTFKGDDFPPPNTVLDDYLMFRVAISALTGSERMERYPMNFTAKGYLNRNHPGTEEAAKRRDPKSNTWHYLMICQTYQLHGEEGEREGLRRILPGVPTIKANEVPLEFLKLLTRTLMMSLVKAWLYH